MPWPLPLRPCWRRAVPLRWPFSDFNPAITVADGNSVIAVHTSGNGLRFYWNEFGTNNWHGEQVAADGTTFSDPAIAQVGNTVVIAAQGIGNSLDLYWQTNGASGWNAETVAAIRDDLLRALPRPERQQHDHRC